jgi:hypothetical protein
MTCWSDILFRIEQAPDRHFLDAVYRRGEDWSPARTVSRTSRSSRPDAKKFGKPFLEPPEGPIADVEQEMMGIFMLRVVSGEVNLYHRCATLVHR